jgi:hypothetical protein
MVQGDKINEITVGGVTVSVWTAKDPSKSHHDDFKVEVGKPGEDDDWVCVGGGGIGGTEVSFLSHSGVTHFKGNYLTASFPSDDFKSWNVFSRDHQDTYAVELVAFAIGMRIPGINKEELRPNLKLFTSESPSLNHPKHSCSIDSESFLLLGGGFQVLDEPEGGGNMATGSFPDSTVSWRAHSKDHDIDSPSRIKVFAIGIRPSIMKGTSAFGDVTTTYHSFESVAGSGPDSVPVKPLDGFALCGGGAKSHYTLGKLLYGLLPTAKNGIPPNPPIDKSDQEFTGGYNYHGGHVDLGPGTAYAMGIKFKPSSSIPPPPSPTECTSPRTIGDANSSGNVNPAFEAKNVRDGDLNTKWISTNIPNPWISVILEDQKPVCRVDIAWAEGNVRTYNFNIQVSPDITGEQTWTSVFTGQSAGNSTAFESYAITPTPTSAKRVKITITESIPGPSPVQITEIKVFSNV